MNKSNEPIKMLLVGGTDGEVSIDPEVKALKDRFEEIWRDVFARNPQQLRSIFSDPREGIAGLPADE